MPGLTGLRRALTPCAAVLTFDRRLSADEADLLLVRLRSAPASLAIAFGIDRATGTGRFEIATRDRRLMLPLDLPHPA